MAYKVILFVTVALVAREGLSQSVVGNDYLKNTINDKAIKHFFKKYNPQLVISCFETQSQNFIDFGAHMKNITDLAADKIAESIGENQVVPLRKIADTLRDLPLQFWPLIKKEKLAEAMKIRFDAGNIVNEKTREFDKILKNVKENNPQTAENAKKIMRKVQNDAKKRSKVIRIAIKTCIKEGVKEE